MEKITYDIVDVLIKTVYLEYVELLIHFDRTNLKLYDLYLYNLPKNKKQLHAKYRKYFIFFSRKWGCCKI